MKRFLTPFEEISKKESRLLYLAIVSIFLLIWFISSISSDKHIFPSMLQVLYGFKSLFFEEALIHNITASLILFFKSVTIASVISMLLVFSSKIPLFSTLSGKISYLRYIPLAGLTYYLPLIFTESENVQIALLVILTTTFTTTSLLSNVKELDQQIDHAKTIGCSRWEILLEVVIKGRFHYVLDSIRQNLAIIWMSLVFVEGFLASKGGLGFLIKNSEKFSNHGKIIALQIVILLIGIFLDNLIKKSIKIFFRYSKI